jgi:AcrR family transcriptional regulator
MTSETSSSILKAARRLFSQQGYTATAMHEIAAEAGIGKATIYHHFRSKEEIILRLVRDSMENLHEAVKPIEQTEDPRELFRLAALRAITFLYNSTDILQIARREVPGVRELMTDKLIVFFNDFSALLEENLRRGMAMGIFRSVEPHETAAVFITMIQGNFARFFLTRMRPGTPEEATEALLKVFFHGITAFPSGQADTEKD